jgi:hypothetical protein
MAALFDQLGVLGVALAQWDDRGRARHQAGARRAGSTAIDAIDTLITDLTALRARLVSEVRADDDAGSHT